MTSTQDAARQAGCPAHVGGGAGGTGAEAHHGYSPFSMDDPFPSYAALREDEPVMFDERTGYWVVSRYEDVKAVFEDWETFSSENAQAPVRPPGEQARRIMAEGGFTAYSGLSARVPPEHTRIRKVVAKAFTPRRYKVLEPAIRAHAARLLEQMLARPERTGDLLRDLAYDVPTVTILTLIGADTSQVDLFKTWSDSRAAMTWGDLGDEEQVPHAHNLVAYWQECLRLVRVAHEELPDSLVGDLVRAQQAGDPVTDHEIASVCYSLLFAGHETTTTLISNALRVLLAHPQAWQALVADPTGIPAAIDEVLRFSPSIVAWRRKALADTTVGGVPIAKGEQLLLLMGSANRDGTRFSDPDHFDASRDNAREHLSFGFGIHYCLGNLLAKLQAKVVLEEVARLAPDLQLVAPEAIRFGDNLSFRAPTAVPVTWPARAGARYVQFFDDDAPAEHDLLGGKCASLVTMTAAGMPVPPGFAVTTAAYDAFVHASGIDAETRRLLAGMDPDDVDHVDEVSARIRELILSCPTPPDVHDAFGEAYERLMARFERAVPVAVRSSATAEDLPDASFAGQQDTYLWLVGARAVAEHVRRCWASLYTSRAIIYRLKNGIPDEGLSMAVAVQKMVDARVAGVAITMNPTTGDRSKIAVDASWGVGEMVVSGLVTPDHVLLDKVMMSVVTQHLGDKHAELVPDPASGRLVEREVEPERRERLCLSPAELVAVATMAKRAERHYGCPQDVEWALDRDLPPGQDLLLLQARPETVHSSAPAPVPVVPVASAPTPSAGFSMSGLTSALTRPAGG